MRNPTPPKAEYPMTSGPRILSLSESQPALMVIKAATTYGGVESYDERDLHKDVRVEQSLLCIPDYRPA